MKTKMMMAALMTMAAMPVMAATTADVQKEAQEFVKQVSISNAFEIETSKVALTRSQDANVRKFAQDMVVDHTKAGLNFKKAILMSGLKLTPYKLDSEHQKKLDELKSADAKDFNDKYVDLQEDAHEKAVDVFEDYTEAKNTNPALLAFANKTLPTLKAHEVKIKQIDDAK